MMPKDTPQSHQTHVLPRPDLAHWPIDPCLFNQLPIPLQLQLLHYSLRWRAYEEILQWTSPPPQASVTELTLRAQAWCKLKMPDQAIEEISQSPIQSQSFCLQKHLIWGYAQAGNLQHAYQLLSHLLQTPDAPPWCWSVVGALDVMREAWRDAEQAYHRHQHFAPKSRVPLLGLMRLYMQCGQSATAMAHAACALQENEASPPTIPELWELLEFFQTYRQARYAERVTHQLCSRYQRETQALKEQMAPFLSPLSTTTRPQEPYIRELRQTYALLRQGPSATSPTEYSLTALCERLSCSGDALLGRLELLERAGIFLMEYCEEQVRIWWREIPKDIAQRIHRLVALGSG